MTKKLQYPRDTDDFEGNAQIVFSRLRAVNTHTHPGMGAEESVVVDPGTGEGLIPEEVIRMFVPPGLVFPDGSQYSNTDLGLAGGMVASAARGKIGEDAAKAVENINWDEAKDFASGALIATGLSVAAMAAGKLFGDTFAGAVGGAVGVGALSPGLNFGTGRVFNPNTKSLFQGVNIRSFTFQFHMIPQSALEAESVAEITKIFRKHVYPEKVTTGLSVKFPDKWLVEIFPGPLETKDDYKIKFKPAFLTSMSRTYNPTATSFHADGAPVETLITLNFTESVTIDQQDVEDGF